MTENTNRKAYDLEERTFAFAKNVRTVVQVLPKTLMSIDDVKQVIRSSGSVGANYIEANEALSKKDFILRIKICRKEAKETSFWLKLLQETIPSQAEKLKELENESTELMKIFGAIIQKSK